LVDDFAIVDWFSDILENLAITIMLILFLGWGQPGSLRNQQISTLQQSSPKNGNMMNIPLSAKHDFCGDYL
jgi:hypothetical protein